MASASELLFQYRQQVLNAVTKRLDALVDIVCEVQQNSFSFCGASDYSTAMHFMQVRVNEGTLTEAATGVGAFKTEVKRTVEQAGLKDECEDEPDAQHTKHKPDATRNAALNFIFGTDKHLSIAGRSKRMR